MSRTTYHIVAGLLAILVCSSAAICETPKVKPESVKQAVKFFSDKLAGANDLDRAIVLRGLESIKDKQLLPLFSALMQSHDKELRLMGTAMIGSVAGKDAVPALLERLRKDPSMAIRGEALVQLGALDAISISDLEKAADIDDEGIQIVAARMLNTKGKTQHAREILTRLTESREPANIAFARMTLLGMGDRRQYAKLLRMIRDPKTDNDVVVRLLNQIVEDKIDCAVPMAESISTDEHYPWDVRLRAYDVISELSPKGTQKLTAAFNAADNMLLRMNLLQMLADREDSRDQINRIAAGSPKDLVTIVAQFEQARKTKPFDPAAAERIAFEMVEQGHPIYIEYLLTRMSEDIEKDQSAAGFYAAPVVKYLSSVKLPRRMNAEHGRAGKAVELLVELGDETSMKGLWDIVSASGDAPIKRLTVASMYRSDNDKVCDFVTPLLNSGYPDLKKYAALLLGKHNKSEAIGVLEEMQGFMAKKKDPGLKSLVGWYIISFSGNPSAAVTEISKTIK